MKLELLSLFSGCGGLDLGFHAAGFETVLALDSSSDAVASFNANLPGKVARKEDLSTLSPEAFLDIIPNGSHPVGMIGGPPCQGFSVGNVFASTDDVRNQLPFRYSELLMAANERFDLHFFVFENVIGLKGRKFAAHYKKLVDSLSDAGFHCFEGELNASNFDVAQRRKRLFLVGLNKEFYPELKFEFPEGAGKTKTVKEAIEGLPEPQFFRRDLRKEDIRHHPNHWSMMPKSSKFAADTNTTGRSFRRIEWGDVSPTVAYGHREVHVHPSGTRRLSVYESMLLQGFTEEAKLIGTLSSQITQISNAVPPPVALAVAEALLRQLCLGQDKEVQEVTAA